MKKHEIRLIHLVGIVTKSDIVNVLANKGKIVTSFSLYDYYLMNS